ncbi:MAG: DNA mismatch repair endonuclease MutL [Christensenellales bacterium]
MKILQLSPQVVGQIAAGEVVERPAAAVKELVENSMDAGATAITVDIRDGGLTSLRVVDNGSGIPSSELRMAFLRHATSKLRESEELAHIMTLGFRGEALASIAAVAKVTLLTRTHEEETGTQVLNEGGEILDIRPAACAEGTAITVRDLFYNAPVRRKFMKKAGQETQEVAELIARLILSHPGISFRFLADGKSVYFSPGDGRQETALMSVYGVSLLKQLQRVAGSEQGLLLNGFVGVGEASRGNRAHQHIFLNGRAMRSPLLSTALEEACRQRVMVGRFPFCALWLTLPYEAVDVNVHPNKWEVRFQDEGAVSSALRHLVADALSGGAGEINHPSLFRQTPGAPGVPAQIVREAPAQEEKSEQPASFPPRLTLRSPLWEQAQETLESPAVPEAATQMTAARQLPQLDEKPLRLIGAAFNTYILYESGDTLCLCDQHAMHERLMYDRLMKAYGEGALGQTLLMPQALTLSYREYGSFLEHQALLAAAGFDAEDFGEQTVKLHTVPIYLGRPQAESAFLEALDDLAAAGGIKDDKRVERIIQAACKHAVKGGERLPDEALTALVRGVLEGNVVPTCPHGRPLIMQMTRTELEKRFGRIPG